MRWLVVGPAMAWGLLPAASLGAEVKISKEDQALFCIYADEVYSISAILCRSGGYLRCDGPAYNHQIAHWTIVTPSRGSAPGDEYAPLCERGAGAGQ